MTKTKLTRRDISPRVRSKVWAALLQQKELMAGTLALQLGMPVDQVEGALETHPRATVTHHNALGVKVWGLVPVTTAAATEEPDAN